MNNEFSREIKLCYHFRARAYFANPLIIDVLDEALPHYAQELELRWDWIRILEIGRSECYIDFIVESDAKHSAAELIKVIKRVTAKRINEEYPEVKKLLWSAKLWGSSYSVETLDSLSPSFDKSEGYKLLYKRDC